MNLQNLGLNLKIWAPWCGSDPCIKNLTPKTAIEMHHHVVGRERRSTKYDFKIQFSGHVHLEHAAKSHP